MLTSEEKLNVEWFAAQWQDSQGYAPAPFQKAIALQRLRRGQTIREIIRALVDQHFED